MREDSSARRNSNSVPGAHMVQKLVRSVDLPDVLAQWIQTHMPNIGDPGKIRFRSCRRIPFWWLPGNRNMSGLTLANRVYLRAEHCPIDASNKDTIELVLHELVHVLQFRKNPV